MKVRIKKPRVVKKTLFIGCEGVLNTNFLTYLKSIYSQRDDQKKITISNVNGGNPLSMIKCTVSRTSTSDFDKKYVFIDHDRELNKQAQWLVKKHSIELLFATPCMEGLLLQIIDQAVPLTSKKCKKLLKKKLIQFDDSNLALYAKFFPSDLLESKYKKIPELAALLKIFRER